MALSGFEFLAIPADGFDVHFPITKDIARSPSLCVWVPSCEVPFLFSPCLPGGTPLTHSSSSYPDPQPNEAHTPQAAVSGVGAPSMGHAGRGPAGPCVLGVLRPQLPREQAIFLAVVLVFHHHGTASETSAETPPSGGGRAGSGQDPGALPGPPPALAAAGCLVAEVRM